MAMNWLVVFWGGAFFLTVSGQTFLRGQILALLFPIDSQP